ncbi:hypothetical protein B0T11DRAFT_295770 [Plectosphaerella cucumerina]|uniref:Uncharacterized protein n=1 Tax=Plectosphaerella cucumerina TaxID=40658 RepID=A0A8K0TMU1_9PEZI|nr:hypothetical protein B0T11DRAFT_295770 [Plectosphaerella cucumerina]
MVLVLGKRGPGAWTTASLPVEEGQAKHDMAWRVPRETPPGHRYSPPKYLGLLGPSGAPARWRIMLKVKCGWALLGGRGPPFGLRASPGRDLPEGRENVRVCMVCKGGRPPTCCPTSVLRTPVLSSQMLRTCDSTPVRASAWPWRVRPHNLHDSHIIHLAILPPDPRERGGTRGGDDKTLQIGILVGACFDYAFLDGPAVGVSPRGSAGDDMPRARLMSG